ncbi:hypothetical protein EVAR_88852_1 [Eumeta japonica]|uniref:Uncharacterized protein n=1 Tax=Eumeta variegata TaxID=151549 RepID=A0A4C1Y808_EUMVA|nr:hypothetical protein EVAR_88852_1 [Eumeta japonica]
MKAAEQVNGSTSTPAAGVTEAVQVDDVIEHRLLKTHLAVANMSKFRGPDPLLAIFRVVRMWVCVNVCVYVCSEAETKWPRRKSGYRLGGLSGYVPDLPRRGRTKTKRRGIRRPRPRAADRLHFRHRREQRSWAGGRDKVKQTDRPAAQVLIRSPALAF